MVAFNFSASDFFCLVSIIVLLFVQILMSESVTGVPAVIVFGDSIVDPGNNNNLKTVVKCDFPPYGRDFKEHTPTGRFCNGRIPSDMIASALGIKDIVPAYLDPKLTSEDLVTGVSFGSGGSGYDPLTAELMSVLSLDDQTELFKEYISKLESMVGAEKAANIVSKSLYISVIGTDDWANTYFPTPLRRAHYDVSSYTDLLINSASAFYQELYKLGARQMGVVGLPPLGCLPSQRTLSGGIFRECNSEHNEAALFFNSKLSNEMEKLGAALPGSNIIYIDIYTNLFDIIQYPSKYGFEVVEKGCCGTGNIEVSILCTELSLGTCTDVSDYVFWDSYHPTEKAYTIIINALVKDYLPRLIQ